MKTIIIKRFKVLRIIRLIFLVAGILGISGLKPVFQTPTSAPEYQVKAVFLYNFSQFIEWPDSLISEGKPFVIGILGTDPFGRFLEEVVAGEYIDNRPLVVKKFDSVEEIVDCQILFIGEKDRHKLKNILSRLKDKDVLTVSDVQNFGEMGGIIEFSKEDSKIRLKINPKSAEKAHLNISSKLLRLAEIVSTESGVQQR